MSNINQKTNNIDTYQISEGSFDSKDKYKVEIDFDKEEIRGFYIGRGVFYLVETTKCIEILEDLIRYSKPLPRDITTILNKVKTEISI